METYYIWVVLLTGETTQERGVVQTTFILVEKCDKDKESI